MTTLAKHWRTICGIFLAMTCVGIMAANYWLPADADEEYLYTVQWLGKYLLPLSTTLLFIVLAIRPGQKPRRSFWFFAIGLSLAIMTFWLPQNNTFALASFCWTGAFICTGIGFFCAAAKARALASGASCMLGSLLLAFGIGEIYLLCTEQSWDGSYYDNQNSAYVRTGEAIPTFTNIRGGICGSQFYGVSDGTSVGQRFMRHDQPIFDVKYTFNASGRRILPPNTGKPQFELMLFGCSFTFGHGLENEQTWPWLLAQKLGATWQLENYSFNGFGANQMLCFLEHNLVEQPDKKASFALFLAIKDHLRRNEFFATVPHYILNANNMPVQQGQGKYIWLHKLPSLLPGSQLATLASNLGTALILNWSANDAEKLYVAMLKRSAEILREKYKTELLVLLWPDLDNLALPLRDMGITTINARKFLPDWDAGNGQAYQIAPPYEGHPNARAAAELAAGLANYFTELERKQQP